MTCKHDMKASLDMHKHELWNHNNYRLCLNRSPTWLHDVKHWLWQHSKNCGLEHLERNICVILETSLALSFTTTVLFVMYLLLLSSM